MARAMLAVAALLAGCVRGGFAGTDRSAADAFVGDGVAGGDGGGGDRCGPPPDDETLAYYDFEGDDPAEARDLTGRHPGRLLGRDVGRGPGPAGCGRALRLGVAESTADASRMEIADHLDWQLPVGSLGFHLRFDRPPEGTSGVISRDADYIDEPGHLSVSLNCDRRLTVRLQRDENEGVMRCSAPLAAGVWHEVAVAFGGPEGLRLTIAGDAEHVAGKSSCKSSYNQHCGELQTSAGIDGNHNPWVVGASSHQSRNGEAAPLTNPFVGWIDRLVISRRR